MNSIILKDILRDRVEWSLDVMLEEIEPYGNCLASGDDEQDRQAADDITNQVNSGNIWAWCCVKVSAKYKGFEGYDVLGCCSYKSEEDFRQDGYYADMRDEALNDLVKQLQEAKDVLKELGVIK